MKPRRAKAFTLIELLLAMGMVAMLTLSLYVGLSVAFRARTSVGQQTDAMRHAKTALDLVEQDLRSLLPPAGVLTGPFLGTTSGTATTPAATIDCYALGSDFVVVDDAHADGPRHVQVTLVADAGGSASSASTLVRYVGRDPLNASAATPDEDVLARNVVGFGARYYDGAAWIDTWDSTQQSNALPVAVEISVDIKSPTTVDPDHLYHLARIVTLACGQTAEQAAALAAATAAATEAAAQ